MENKTYRELQAIAKSLGIAANAKKEVLINEINKKQKESDTSTLSEDVTQEANPSSSSEAVLLTVDNEIAMKTVVDTSDVVEFVDLDSSKDEIITTEENDMDCDQAEDNEIDFEVEAGSKLRGIATPLGEKKLFSSPELTKEYEEYNVKWRYEDYDDNLLNTLSTLSIKEEEKEINNTSVLPLATPSKTNSNYSFWAVIDTLNANDSTKKKFCKTPSKSTKTPVKPVIADLIDVEEIDNVFKLSGYPTPKGKKTNFPTPSKSQVNDENTFNVHWRYEDYDNDSSLAQL